MKYDIELKTNHNIPEELKNFIENNNSFRIIIDDSLEEFEILKPIEILRAYTEQDDLFDYDIIPFALLDDDYLCIYFINNKISIIYWSTERALESKKHAIFKLFDSYKDFINECK